MATRSGLRETLRPVLAAALAAALVWGVAPARAWAAGTEELDGGVVAEVEDPEDVAGAPEGDGEAGPAQAAPEGDMPSEGAVSDEPAATEGDIASGVWGTCNWAIASDGYMEIWPVSGGSGVLDGSQGSSSSDPSQCYFPWYEYNSYIKSVEITGLVTIDGSAEGLFYLCQNLTDASLAGLVSSSTTSLNSAFLGCSKLASLDVSLWDTSAVMDIYQVFYGCSSLQSLDLSDWDTSRVTSMHESFFNCSSLESLDVSGWDTSRVKRMSCMFSGCSKLASLDVSGWNTSDVTSLYQSFLGCSSLTSLDVSGWDTSNMTNMYATFFGCSSLQSLDLSGWDTTNVTNMLYMFSSCSNLRCIAVGEDFLPRSGDQYSFPERSGGWWSTSEGAWYSASEIVSSRAGVADVYTDGIILPVSPSDVSLPEDECVYDGTAKTPAVTVAFSGAALAEGTDYRVAYQNNVNAGTATVTVTMQGRYFGKVKKSFTITLRPAVVRANDISKVVGSPDPELSAEVEGTVNGDTLTYNLSRKEGEEPGTYAISPTGRRRQGNYQVTYVPGTLSIWRDVWVRRSGQVALDTMQAVAGEFGKASVAIVTTNADFKDALAASCLAGRHNALVLTTPKGEVANQTKAALKAAGVKTVYLVGSTADVTAATEKALKSGTGVTKVQRISGTSPSAKAIAVAKACGKRSDTVIIATQGSFKDALSIAPYAYATKSPILYAEGNKSLDSATLKYIKDSKFSKAIIVGGPVALPVGIESQLTKSAGIRAANITRLAGSNSYGTSEVIAKWATGQLKAGNYGTYQGKPLATVRFQPSVKLSANKLAVATSQGWKDALCGAALCGKSKSVLLLADSKTSGSNWTLACGFCADNKDAITRAYVLGGTSAVSQKVWDALVEATG